MSEIDDEGRGRRVSKKGDRLTGLIESLIIDLWAVSDCPDVPLHILNVIEKVSETQSEEVFLETLSTTIQSLQMVMLDTLEMSGKLVKRTDQDRQVTAFENAAGASNVGVEADPSGLGYGVPGTKFDMGKPFAGLLLEDFGLALLDVAGCGTFGAVKHSRSGWKHVEDGINVYKDAAGRHFLKMGTEERDRDSGCTHISATIWNLLAVVELTKREELEEEKLKNLKA